MVDVDDWLGTVLHLSYECGELLWWLCHDESTTNIVMSVIIIITILNALLLHSQGLKISKVEVYVRSGFDGDSETVNMLARHTALKRWITTEMHWYRNMVFPQIGYAEYYYYCVWYPGISGSGRVFHFWPCTNGYISGYICPSQWGLAFGTVCLSCGMKLDDDAVHVVVSLCLGCSICMAHTCRCGATVDVQGQPGLICKQATSRTVGHNVMNDIIFWSLSSTAIPASKEPTGFTRLDGKHPDGLNLVPWQRGKPVTWDITVVSTLAQVILLLAPRNLTSLGRRPSILVSPRAFFRTSHARNSGGNSSLLFGFSHWSGSVAECHYGWCTRDSILVSAHLCRTSTVQCSTHTRVFCRTRRRAVPLAIPTSVFSFCF